MQVEYGIEFYGRYRDDIMFIARPEHVVPFFQKMKHLAREVYPLTVDCVSSHSLDFLDITFFKGHTFGEHGRLSYRPFFKPTDQRVPLHHTSAHHMNIHMSWPMGDLLRYARHSCNNFVFEQATRFLFEKWCKNYMYVSTVSRFSSNLSIHNYIAMHDKKENRAMTFWLVLPFLKGFNYKPIRDPVSCLVRNWNQALEPVFGAPVQIKLSFKNAGRNVENILKFLDGGRSGGRR